MGLGTLPQQGVCCYREAFLGSRNDQGSMLTLGAIDQSYFIGALHWVPVTVQGYWQFTVDRWVSGTLYGPLPEADSWCVDMEAQVSHHRAEKSCTQWL